MQLLVPKLEIIPQVQQQSTEPALGHSQAKGSVCTRPRKLALTLTVMLLSAIKVTQVNFWKQNQNTTKTFET